jgi:hypothetical protein
MLLMIDPGKGPNRGIIIPNPHLRTEKNKKTSLYIDIYIYMYININVDMYIYIYIYIYQEGKMKMKLKTSILPVKIASDQTYPYSIGSG